MMNELPLVLLIMLLIAVMLRLDFIFYLIYVMAGVYIMARWWPARQHETYPGPAEFQRPCVPR